MVKIIAIILLVMTLLKSCWSSKLGENFPVKICVIGEGSGFTCQNVVDEIENHITGECYWSFQRFDQPGHTIIGPYLRLNQDSKIGEYFCWNRINNRTEVIVFVMPAGNQFSCPHCVGMTTCHNGLQAEFHLMVNINHQIIDRTRCSLYRNDYELICVIGISHCLVDTIDSSDRYFVKCPIRDFNVNMMSAEKRFNSTLPGCTAFSQEATGPSSTCQGSDAKFKCQILSANHTASPAVWRRDRQLIENSTKHTPVFNTTDGVTYLVVHSVSVDEDGGAQYTCSDAESTISSSVMLNVTGPPSSRNITITHHCLTHLTIFWTSNYTTCGPVSHHVTTLHHDRVIQTTTVNGTSGTLTGLVPATNYTITINSSNNAGHSIITSTTSTVGHITNLRNSTYNMNSVTILWDNVVIASPNCEEEKHYIVDLSHPDGKHVKTNVTTNHITFENLTQGTTYVVTVAVASTTGVASSSEIINVTTATQLETDKGDESSAIPITVTLVIVTVLLIITFLITIIGFLWYSKHCNNSKPLPDDSISALSVHCPEQETVKEATGTPHYDAFGHISESDGAASLVHYQPTNNNNAATVAVHPKHVFILYAIENEHTTAKIHEFSDYLRSKCEIDADVDLYHSSEKISSWPLWVEQQCKTKKGFIILIWSDGMDKILNHSDINNNNPIQMTYAHLHRQSLLSLIDERRQDVVVVCLDSNRELLYIKQSLPLNLKQGTVYNISLKDLHMMTDNQVQQFATVRNLLSVLKHQQEFERPDTGSDNMKQTS